MAKTLKWFLEDKNSQQGVKAKQLLTNLEAVIYPKANLLKNKQIALKAFTAIDELREFINKYF